jgi:hypothetical protein
MSLPTLCSEFFHSFRGIKGDFKMRLKKLPNGLIIRGIFY